MGERGERALRVKFDAQLKLTFHGTTLSSDARLLLYRELDEALGLATGLEEKLEETCSSIEFLTSSAMG